MVAGDNSPAAVGAGDAPGAGCNPRAGDEDLRSRGLRQQSARGAD